jgi:hypothetical protein
MSASGRIRPRCACAEQPKRPTLRAAGEREGEGEAAESDAAFFAATGVSDWSDAQAPIS